MFSHIFFYRIKCIIKDKEMMFWTLAFPVVLAIFFNLAFSNLNSDEAFTKIPIAIVLNENYPGDGTIKQTLDSLSDDSEGKALFVISEVTMGEAASMLENGEISAYIISGNEIEIFVRGTGFNQTITKFVFDSILRTGSLIGKIAEINPDAFQAGLITFLSSEESYLASPSSDNAVSPDNTLIYFYSLMAMTCFYGAFSGIKEVNAVQADLTPQGMRVSVSPLKKMPVFFTSITAASIIQLSSIMILLVFLMGVLKIDFGNQAGYIFLLCFSGCMVGISFGAMIGALIKGREGLKVALLIVSTMVMSFFAGMMQSSIKYAVNKALPILAFINPVSLITDAFYALYYYPGHERYFLNILLIWCFTIVFSTVTIFRLRRLKYASI